MRKNTHKIFFSYARADASQFAGKLARDLLNEGIDIWIDQLHIRAGETWDVSVEKALKASDCIIFIVTEKSIISTTVLDEVSYALEEKKIVIPLLVSKCQVPFRVRRLQHIDFTLNYANAYDSLLNTLSAQKAREHNGENVFTKSKEESGRELSATKGQVSLLGSFSEGLALLCLTTRYLLMNHWVNKSTYGYLRKSGKAFIAPKYDMATPFSGGLAAVYTDGGWTYIDKAGKEITQEIYQEAKNFSDGLAVIKKVDRWGYIDPTGEEVIPTIYTRTDTFSEKLAVVQIDYDLEGYIDQNGKQTLPAIYHSAKPFSENLALVTFRTDYDDSLKEWHLQGAYIDNTGKNLIRLKEKFSPVSAGAFSEGFAAVYDSVTRGWGYIDTSGDLVIKGIYEVACCFFEGLALVKRYGRWGYIDHQGKEVIPLRYFDAGHFSDGLALVCIRDKIGYIDRSGCEVIPIKYPRYLAMFDFQCGDLPLEKINKFPSSFSEGLAVVQTNDKWLVINKVGKVVSK